MKSITILLAAGRGSRFMSDKKKQFVHIDGRPLLYYSLKAFNESNVDEIIIVTSKEDIEYLRKEIVLKYSFTKVTDVVIGGSERYDSVNSGLNSIEDDNSICLIHDSARAMVSIELINKCIEETYKYPAVIPVVSMKDTVRVRKNGFGGDTLDRDSLCIVQTPQCFDTKLIKSAFKKMYKSDYKKMGITDDAMVVEKFTSTKIRLIDGDCRNIKVTTLEDIEIAKAFLSVK